MLASVLAALIVGGAAVLRHPWESELTSTRLDCKAQLRECSGDAAGCESSFQACVERKHSLREGQKAIREARASRGSRRSKARATRQLALVSFEGVGVASSVQERKEDDDEQQQQQEEEEEEEQQQQQLQQLQGEERLQQQQEQQRQTSYIGDDVPDLAGTAEVVVAKDAETRVAEMGAPRKGRSTTAQEAAALLSPAFQQHVVRDHAHQVAALKDERARQCFSLLSNVSDLVIGPGGLIWCVNAKTGSSSIFRDIDEILSREHERRDAPDVDIGTWATPHEQQKQQGQTQPGQAQPGKQQQSQQGRQKLLRQKTSLPMASARAEAVGLRRPDQLSTEEKVALCNGKHVTFTVVRNPYERIISAFLDKVACDTADSETHRWIEARAHLGEKEQSFDAFVEWIGRFHAQGKAQRMNVHLKSFSDRCLTHSVDYDLVGHLEKFDEAMEALHRMLDVGRYTKAPPAMAACHTPPARKKVAYLAKRLRGGPYNGTDFLKLRGRRKLDAWYTDRTREVVSKVYALDLETHGYGYGAAVPRLGYGDEARH